MLEKGNLKGNFLLSIKSNTTTIHREVGTGSGFQKMRHMLELFMKCFQTPVFLEQACADSCLKILMQPVTQIKILSSAILSQNFMLAKKQLTKLSPDGSVGICLDL